MTIILALAPIPGVRNMLGDDTASVIALDYRLLDTLREALRESEGDDVQGLADDINAAIAEVLRKRYATGDASAATLPLALAHVYVLLLGNISAQQPEALDAAWRARYTLLPLEVKVASEIDDAAKRN